MMTIKASFGADIRRFTFDSEDVRLNVLAALIAKDFGLEASSLVLKYEDDEGDLCLITSEEELREAIRLANGTLKVMVQLDPTSVVKPVPKEHAKPLEAPEPKAEAKAEAKPVEKTAEPVKPVEPITLRAELAVAKPTVEPVVEAPKEQPKQPDPVKEEVVDAKADTPESPASKKEESIGWMDWLKRKAEPKRAQTSANSVQFMTDVTLPDGSVHAPGVKATKVWRVRNDGKEAWTAHSTLIEKDGGEVLELPALNPNQVTDLAIDVTLPATEGQHRMEYFLVDATNLKFQGNNHLWTDIIVVKEEEVKAEVESPAEKPKEEPKTDASPKPVVAAQPAAKPVVAAQPVTPKPVAQAKPVVAPAKPSKQELIAQLRGFLAEAQVQEALKQASPLALQGIANNKPARLLIPEIVASQPVLASHPFIKSTLLPTILPRISKQIDALAPMFKMVLCRLVGDLPMMAGLAPEELAKLFDDEAAEAKHKEPTPPAQPRAETPSKEVVIHRGITCDHCGMTPIKGIRFKCTVCADYDLCESCEAKDAHDNDHQMLKIRKAAQAPKKEPPLPRSSWMSSWRAAEPAPVCTPTPASTPVPPSSPCKLARQPSGKYGGKGGNKKEKTLSAKFLDDVTVRDGTIVAPKTTVVKTWKVQNDGTAAWPADLALVNTSGKILLAPGAQPAIPAAEAGANADVSANVQIPDELGRLNGYFRLSKGGKKFGPRMWLDVTSDVPKAEAVVVPSANAVFAPAVAKAVAQPAAARPVVGASAAAPAVAAPAEPVFEGPNADKLEQLHLMGFSDQALNKDLLVAADGDLLKVITWLLTKK